MTELLHYQLGRAVAAHPQRPAVRLGDKDLSYGELDQQSLRVAHLLCDAGLRRGDRVALYQTKSIEMIVGIYGILRAGCCFVPIDPRSPKSRVEAIIDDCAVRAMVTDASGYAALETIDVAQVALVIHTDDVTVTQRHEHIAHHSWDSLADSGQQTKAQRTETQHPETQPPETQHPEIQPLPSVQPDDLAYIMYTSGSTGAPKGMMHSHRSSLGFARWGEHFCELHSHDVVANFSPLHFDISVFDIFSAMLGASCVVLVPERVQLFAAQVAKLLETSSTTVIFTVPFALTRLATMGALAERDLSAIRWVLFGGEPFQPSDLAALMRSLPNARFANVYGPAEAPACVVHEVLEVPVDGAPIPIGQLAPDTQGRIVEGGGIALVEPGTIGELLIASPSITLGYWNRTGLNAATRVTIDDQEFFRTGDLVVERTQGILDFIGRNDRMIKSRGFRIELDEIEAALANHPMVSEAAVYAVVADGTHLVHASVVLRDVLLEKSVLIEHLADRVPAYAIPVTIDVVAEMPRTTSDKIDRRALASRTEAAHSQGDNP